MPELDFAFVCDFARADAGLGHAIGISVDTIYAAEVPTGHNLGLLARVMFTRNECDRPHRLELYFQDADGTRLVALNAIIEPEWPEELPVGWRVGALMPAWAAAYRQSPTGRGFNRSDPPTQNPSIAGWRRRGTSAVSRPS
jgi:uncharacterized protein DUF6941